MAHRQLFALPARRAEKENLQLARIQIKFADHPELETAAFEAGHREPPERAVRRRLGRGIILAPLEKAGSTEFHPRILPPQMDICSPTSISAFGFVLFPALKPSCGIHARSLRQASDNGCPRQIY